MKLRVAYDVSFCGDFHARGAHVTGVGRVIENIAKQIAKSSTSELSFTGCYGGDSRPVLTSANSWLYHKSKWKNGPAFLGATASKTGLFPLYAAKLTSSNACDEDELTSAQKLERKALNGFARWDSPQRSLNGHTDIFHSPFRPLPETSVFSGPALLTVHDLFPLEEPADSYNRAMLEKTLALLDPSRCWVMCVSEYTRKELLKISSFPEERTVVTPLAAEPFFRPIKDKELRAQFLSRFQLPDAPFFLSVSNPQPRKNIPFLIRCFQEFAASDARHHLVLAGSRKLGWGHDAVDRQIDEAPELRDRIHFLGAVSDLELAMAYSFCTAFVFPSLQEGFGLPPLEAMQCGAPVICSNATSLPEVTGEASISLVPDDSAGLVSALRRISSDDAMRRQLSAASLDRAGKFSWTKTAQIVEETYQHAWRKWTT